MKKIKKAFKAMVAGMVILCSSGFVFTGCNAGFNDEFAVDSGARVATKGAEDWEQFTDGEIEKAKKECPKSEKKKVESFEGALSRLFNLGANLALDEIEDDQLYMFAGYGKAAIGAGMKYLDGLLDSYTGGFYKTALGFLWPQEKEVDPAIKEIQESITVLQEGVDTIIADVGKLAEDINVKYCTTDVADRLYKVCEMNNKYEELFAILSQLNAKDDMSYKTFYELKLTALDYFRSIENMKSQTMTFFESYYNANISGKTFGQAYRDLGESMYPWRYQSNEFIQQMMAIELAPATRMFTVCDLLMNPCNDNFQKSLLLKFIANHFSEKDDIETRYIEALHNGNAEVVAEIESLMDDVKNIAEFKQSLTAAGKVWDALVDKFSTYAYTINNTEIPGENSPAEITCNVRRVRYTFSANVGYTDYTWPLKELSWAETKYKTNATWKNIYTRGIFTENYSSDLLNDMLTVDQFQALLDFYSSKNLKPTNGKFECKQGTDGKWYMKKFNGNALDVNLFNIFKFDADTTIMMNRNGYTDIYTEGTEYPMIACLDTKNDMGFSLYGEESGDWYRIDGRHYWKVDVNYVDSNASSVSKKSKNILNAMTARKDNKAKIANVKYYDNSYVSDKLFAIIGIVSNNDAKFNK